MYSLPTNSPADRRHPIKAGTVALKRHRAARQPTRLKGSADRGVIRADAHMKETGHQRVPCVSNLSYRGRGQPKRNERRTTCLIDEKVSRAYALGLPAEAALC
jgi:hypothetical protein